MSDFNIEFEENDQQIKLEFESGVGGAVSSVNGMTGDVVLDAEDVGAYVKPSGGIPASDIAFGVVPAVDNTLTVSGAAADAKKTGDEITSLKDGFTNEFKEVGFVDYLDWGDGYFDNTGNVLSPSANAEKYTVNYIPVLSGEVLKLTIGLNAGAAQWSRWVFYDSTKRSFTYGAYPQTWTQTANITIEVPQNACYVRISFRSFNNINSFSLVRNSSVIETLSKFETQVPRKTGSFISICHQGYSETDSVGHNLLSGYSLARKHGFDWGECDLKKTSDNILVCCHDVSFEDQTTHETVVISEHTLAELQTYNYYGSTIATLEDVIKECKINGIGLAIDQIGNDIKSWVAPLVKKYAMQEQVAYVIQDNSSYPDLVTAIYTEIHNQDPYATFFVIAQPDNINHAITFCNTIKEASNKVVLYLNYAAFTVADLLTIQNSLDTGINIGVWTIDYIPTFETYLPYVEAVTSNKVSSTDIFS